MMLMFLMMALAQEAKPIRYNVSLGGLWIAGNLNQVMLNTSGLVSYDKGSMGNDLLLNGYRIYMKPQEDFVRIGDDLSITTVPFYYFNPKIYSFGVGHWSMSLLHRIDSRFFAGGGIGYAPVRRPDFLIRMGVGGFYEHTDFPDETFNLEVSHNGGTRVVPRVGFVSNGWFRPKGSAISFRYFVRGLVNPLETEDFRYTIDGSSNWHIFGPVSLRLGIRYVGSSVVLEGVETYDIRTTIGIAFSNRKRK